MQTRVPAEKDSRILVTERREVFFAFIHEAVDQLVVGEFGDPGVQPDLKESILQGRAGDLEDVGQLIE